MSEVIYREDMNFDVQLVIDLCSTVEWAAGRDLDTMRKALQNSTLLVTAWEDSHLVGMARVISDNTYFATIWDVIVNPTYRGRGIGRKLMQKILQHPKLQHFQVVALFSAPGKEGFYEKMGFHLYRRGMKLGDYDSMLSMEF